MHYANDGELHIRFSDDYGVTWSDEDKYLDGTAITNFPMNPPGCGAGEDAGEPWLYIAPNGDLLIHMWLVDYGVSSDGTYQSRSTDGGLTWSIPAQIDFIGVVDDTLVFATDDDFVFGGVIYAGARVYLNMGGGLSTSRSVLIKSTDSGVTWEMVSIIQDYAEFGGGQEVGIEYIGSNTIVAMLRDNGHVASYKRVSTDMGATWGALIDVTSTVGIAARQRVFTLAHLRGESNWWTDPNMIMCGFVHMRWGDATQRRNCFWLSNDSGTNWSGPHWVDDTDEDGGYGDLFYRPTDGKYILVSYHGTQAEANLVQYDINL